MTRQWDGMSRAIAGKRPAPSTLEHMLQVTVFRLFIAHLSQKMSDMWSSEEAFKHICDDYFNEDEFGYSLEAMDIIRWRLSRDDAAWLIIQGLQLDTAVVAAHALAPLLAQSDAVGGVHEIKKE